MSQVSKILTKASFEYLTLNIASLSPKNIAPQTLESDLTWIKDSLLGHTVIRQGSLNVRADDYPVNSLFWSLHFWMNFCILLMAQSLLFRAEVSDL